LFDKIKARYDAQVPVLSLPHARTPTPSSTRSIQPDFYGDRGGQPRSNREKFNLGVIQCNKSRNFLLIFGRTAGLYAVVLAQKGCGLPLPSLSHI
jgi:hypothetical protein